MSVVRVLRTLNLSKVPNVSKMSRVSKVWDVQKSLCGPGRGVTGS